MREDAATRSTELEVDLNGVSISVPTEGLTPDGTGLTGQVRVAAAVRLARVGLAGGLSLGLRLTPGQPVLLTLRQSRPIAVRGALQAVVQDAAGPLASGALHGTWTVADGAFVGTGAVKSSRSLILGTTALRAELAAGATVGVKVAESGDPTLLLDGLGLSVLAGSDAKVIARATANRASYDGATLTGSFSVAVQPSFTVKAGPLAVSVSGSGPIQISYNNGKFSLDGTALSVKLDWNGHLGRVSWPKWKLDLGELLGPAKLELPNLSLGGILDWLRGLFPAGGSAGPWPPWLLSLWGKLSAIPSNLAALLRAFGAWVKGLSLLPDPLPLLDLGSVDLIGPFRPLYDGVLEYLGRLQLGPIPLRNLAKLFDGLGLGAAFDWLRGLRLGKPGLELGLDATGAFSVQLRGTEWPVLVGTGVSATLTRSGKRLARLAADEVRYDGRVFRATFDLHAEPSFGLAYGAFGLSVTGAKRVVVSVPHEGPVEVSIATLGAALSRDGKLLARGELEGVGISADGVSAEGASLTLADDLAFGVGGVGARIKQGAKLGAKVANDAIESLSIQGAGFTLAAKAGLARAMALSGTIERAFFDAKGAISLAASMALDSPISFAGRSFDAALTSGTAHVEMEENALSSVAFDGMSLRAKLGGMQLRGGLNRGSYSVDEGLSLSAFAVLERAVDIGPKGKTRIQMLPETTVLGVDLDGGVLTRVNGSVGVRLWVGGKPVIEGQVLGATYDVAAGSFSGEAMLRLTDAIRLGRGSGLSLRAPSVVWATVADNQLVGLRGAVSATAFDARGEPLADISLGVEEGDLTGDEPRVGGTASVTAARPIRALNDALTVEPGGGFQARVEDNELVELSTSGVAFHLDKLGKAPIGGRIGRLRVRLDAGIPDLSFLDGAIDWFSLGSKLRLTLPRISLQGGSFNANGLGRWSFGPVGSLDLGVHLDNLSGWRPRFKLAGNLELPLLAPRLWFMKSWLLESKTGLRIFGVGYVTGGLRVDLMLGNQPLLLKAALAGQEIEIDPAHPVLPDFEAEASVEGGLFATLSVGGQVEAGLGLRDLAWASVILPANATVKPTVAFKAGGRIAVKAGDIGGQIDAGFKVDAPADLTFAPYAEAGIAGFGTAKSGPLVEDRMSLGNLWSWQTTWRLPFGESRGQPAPTAQGLIAPGAELADAAPQVAALEKGTQERFAGGAMLDKLEKVKTTVSLISSVIDTAKAFRNVIASFLPPTWSTAKDMVSEGLDVARNVIDLYEKLQEASENGTLAWIWEMIPSEIRTFIGWVRKAAGLLGDALELAEDAAGAVADGISYLGSSVADAVEAEVRRRQGGQ